MKRNDQGFAQELLRKGISFLRERLPFLRPEDQRMPMEEYAPDEDGYFPYGRDPGSAPVRTPYMNSDPLYEGNQNYDAEAESYRGGRGDPFSGSYEFLERYDWVVWALLVLLPPLGIWILWKQERLEVVLRAVVSAASLIWFILLLVWVFTRLFSGMTDSVVNPPTVTLPPNASSLPTLAPAGADAQGVLPTLAPGGGADASATVPPANSSGGANLGSDTGTPTETAPSDDTANSQDVWATTSGAFYHRVSTCTRIAGGTPQRITLAAAKAQGKSACDYCYTSDASGTPQANAGAFVYANKNGKWFHKASTCAESKMSNSSRVTLTVAQKNGKTPCPFCIGAYFMTQNGRYYHSKSNCSGMSGASRVTAAQIRASKKAPCPTCIRASAATASNAGGVRYYSTAGGKYYHAKAACSGMKNAQRVTLSQASARKQTPCPVCIGTRAAASSAAYYSTSAGKYYHVRSTCSGMKGASRVTLATARTRGQTPCPVCMKAQVAAQAVYYATSSNKYYHRIANCQGLQGASKITLASARAHGKTPCPVCLGGQIGSSYVFMSSGGKYYHSTQTCSGMKSASVVTLAVAKNRGATACPYCMKVAYFYATTSNPYFHLRATCMNMKNASRVTLVSARAKGKIACPICVTRKATANDFRLKAYVATGSRYYHRTATCSGMRNAKLVTLAAAKVAGRAACPVCVLKLGASSVSADAKVACYLVRNGVYYHATRGCALLAGMSGIGRTSVARAKSARFIACPLCVSAQQRTYVYAVPAGLLYHRSPTCSGMRNPMKLTLQTALERAYRRCTKCNAPAAK